MLTLVASLACFALIAGVVAAVIARSGRLARLDQEGHAPGGFLLEPRAHFFSRAEQAFCELLQPEARARGLLVFAKVGLNDLFEDSPRAPRGQYFRYAQLHVDFLLVRASDSRPVAGIELDGPGHASRRQRGRDEKKAAVFKAARLPLLRFYNAAPHAPDAIGAKLADALGEAVRTTP